MTTPGEMDVTLAGMDLEGGIPDMEQPLAGLAILKGLDSDGDVAFWVRSTEGVTRIEAMGMALYLLDSLRNAKNEW